MGIYVSTAKVVIESNIKHLLREIQNFSIENPIEQLVNGSSGESKKEKKYFQKSRTHDKNENDYDSDPIDDTDLNQSHDSLFEFDHTQYQSSKPNNQAAFPLPELVNPSAYGSTFMEERKRVIHNRTYRKMIGQWQNMTTIKQLVDTLKYHTRNKSSLVRVWFIFYWICLNISFDPMSILPGKRANQSAEHVFKMRKGICSGYANLFKHLCSMMGMRCVYVSGYTKTELLNCQGKEPRRSNHAWNAVQIGQHWYLVEVTWAAGRLIEKDTVFERSLDLTHFLVRPDHFVFTHLPKEERWQHLKRPLSISQHAQMPWVFPAYFQFNLELINPCLPEDIIWLPEKSTASIVIRAPLNVELSLRFTLNDEEVPGGHEIRRSECGHFYYFSLVPASLGLHIISISASRALESEGSCAIKFKYNVTQLLNPMIRFPKTWQAFYEHGLEIVNPRNIHCINFKSPNQNHCQILIRTPMNVEMTGELKNSSGTIVNGGDRVYFDQRKNLWRCKFAPNKKGSFQAIILVRHRTQSNDVPFKSAVAFELQVDQLDSPISYPKLLQRFYDLDLCLISPSSRNQLIFNETSGFIRILFRSPVNVQLQCNVEMNGQKMKSSTISQLNPDRQQWELLFAPVGNGFYEVVVAAKQDDCEFEPVACFSVNIPRFLRRPIRFPDIQPCFYSSKCYIYSPVEDELRAGVNLLFRYYIPGATNAFVEIDDNEKQSLKSVGPIFEQQLTVGYQKVIIFAQFGEACLLLARYVVK